MRNEPTGTRDRRRLCVLALALAVAIPSSAIGDEGGAQTPDERDRWVPAASVFGGFLADRETGLVGSSNVLGPRDTSLVNGSDDRKSPNELRPNSGGDQITLAPLVGGSLELMTPRFFGAGGSPRAFAHVGFAVSFSDERTLAGEQKPGPFSVPPLPNTVRSIPERAIVGQGSRTLVKLDPLVFSAGLGVAFTVEPWERRLRIKPSFEWLREGLEVNGILHRAVTCVPNASPPPTCVPTFPVNTAPGAAKSLSDFRLISLQRSEKRIFHGIGPGLELEGDTARLGPFMLSIYASGQLYYFLGNRRIDLAAQNQFGEWAFWRFDKSAWGWRGNVGLRFRWLPE